MKMPRWFNRPPAPLPMPLTAELTAAQREYLSLLKKTILNSVYHPGPHVPEGKVWPKEPALSMIGQRRLDNVQELALNCLRRGIPGDFIEAGIWKGGVIALLAGLLKVVPAPSRRVLGVDSFEGIPPAKPELYPADAAHVGCDTYEILKNNSQKEVEEYLSRLGLLPSPEIKLLKGWFCDVLPRLARDRFCLVRVDGDTYESTSQALEYLEPNVSPGGYIIIDDYFSWQGCRVATDDHRAKHKITAPLIRVDWTCVYWEK